LPFGLTFASYSRPASTSQNFKYNDKEIQDELGFDVLDYGLRYYDPAVARFTTVDPLADQFSFQSPYLYASNNPIRFEDKDGAASDDKVKGGPFNSNNVIRTNTGQIIARRITTNERKTMGVTMGVASTLPITRVMGTAIGLANEGMKATSGTDNSLGTNSTVVGGTEVGKKFFDEASKDAGNVVNHDKMRSAKGVVGKAGTAFGAYQIYSDATSSATQQEVLENFTFEVAEQGSLGKVDLVNEGVFRFGNNDLTTDQATKVMNATFNEVSNTLSGFDLTTDDGVNQANEYLNNKDNLKSLINAINKSMSNE